MSDWKASPSDLKKLHTDSNLKTNTSFEFAQSTHFDFAPHHPTLPEEQSHSNVYIELNNNSTFSLQPTVTPVLAQELLSIAAMVSFFAGQIQEKRKLVRQKQDFVNRLANLLADEEERIKSQSERFRRHKQEFFQKRKRVDSFKKKKLRALTEQTDEMQLQIKCMMRGIKVRNNTDRSHYEKSQKEESLRATNANTKRKKIYVPIFPPYPYPLNYHPPIIKSQTQPPAFINYQPMPSKFPSQSYDSHPTYQNTKQKQPIIIEQLREALTLKLKDERGEADPNLDYFDRPIDTPSKSRQQGRGSETPKSNIRKSSSIKWRKDDHEDKQLVQIIQNSMKHIKIEDESVPQKVEESELERMSPIRPVPRLNSDSSSINITYDSQDKRYSKSFQREDVSQKKKLSSKNSEKKSEHSRQLQQSNIRIDLIDMSISKNSNSSKSDSSKQPPRYIPSLNQPFKQIQEEPEESLKATPIDHKLKNSNDLPISNKKQDTPVKPIIRSSHNINKEEEEEDDQILKSIRLDTESRISRNKNTQNSLSQLQQDAEGGDDLLDGITLLKESRASREKALSLRSSALQELAFQDEEKEKEKGSQSEIFSKAQNDDLPLELFDSSIRLSTRSKIVKTKPHNDASKRGHTEPIKGQLSSIPSAEYEEEEEDTPPQSKHHPKANHTMI